MNEAKSENSKAGMKSLLWMEMLWEGTNTTAREERRKEESPRGVARTGRGL